MNPEKNFNEPALEQALAEIRDAAVDPAVIDAAANRVWERLAQAAHTGSVEHIRSCSDFQALIPDYRAGRLTDARSMLLKDHLHECVACRRVYEGRVTEMPVARKPRTVNYTFRWAAAAAVVAAAGLSIWVLRDQFGGASGRAIVQTLNGSLFEVTASGIVPLAQGQEFPDGVEIRTAKDSAAVLQLRDGSILEMRERSGFQTSRGASDLTIRLDAGSIIVQAAKRSSGHLYVDTADYRVAVTGTIFGVSAGVKGSRVSVVQGEVHVSQNNHDKVLKPGEQAVSSPDLAPDTVKEDISWSRDRDRYYALLQQLAAVRAGIEKIELPDLRYSSKILGHLPANTVFYAAVPNMAQYLGSAESVVRQKMNENPELKGLAGTTSQFSQVIERLRAASEYLGDEVVMAVLAGPNGNPQAPVFVAEVKRDGFDAFLKKQGLPAAIESSNGLTVFGPDQATVQQVTTGLGSNAFQSTPFYARIADAYNHGAGLLLCADVSQLNGGHGAPMMEGARYLIAEQKEVAHKMEARASLAFDQTRTGVAAWLATPAPMGSLDYVSPEATLVASFVANNPGAIVDALGGVVNRKTSELGATGNALQAELASALGGEFTFAIDGPLMPVPSWKLVAEVYDQSKVQTALQKGVDALNQSMGKSAADADAWRMSQETVDGRVYYGISCNRGPLMEAHYTFADGYFIGGSTRALVSRALQVKMSGASVKHAQQFVAMLPRDHYANFSAVFYENLGTTLAPIAGLMGAFTNGNPQQQKMLQGLGNVKPTLIAAYGEPNALTIASGDNVLGAGLSNLMTGNLAGLVGNVLPMGQFAHSAPSRDR